MSKITILDGGISTQLSTHVGQNVDGDPLWTARFLATNPEAVLATHLDFLRAGSDMIQTNTYQASIPGFVKYLGISEEESLKLIYDAVDLAKKAINLYKKEIEGKTDVDNQNPLIVGSCGPYGAALHDGSEYTGAYGSSISPELMAKWHEPRIKALIDKGVVLLALETIPSVYEAEALLDMLQNYPNIKAWLSFSCRDDGISIADGSNFQEVAMRCYKRAMPGQLIAVGVNCLAPQLVTSLLKGINESRKKNFVPLVVYPNSGEKYLMDKGWLKESNSYSLEQFVQEWLDLGVRYIGGCCRTYAADIVKIRKEVKCWLARAEAAGKADD